MDAVQFGRWIGERRRALGWNSQRALVEAARKDAYLNNSSLSEDFLARLEAGNLAHPFRGMVRQRVLFLAWLLCKTPQDVRTYLRVAELSALSVEENEHIEHLKTILTDSHKPTLLLLPSRPPRLVGRADELQTLSHALLSSPASVYAITGMAGIGKSALAYEVVHQLAANERERRRLFPDGIVMLTCTCRCGSEGLLSLLREIVGLFHEAEQVKVGGTATEDRNQQQLTTRGNSRKGVPKYTRAAELTEAMNEARAALHQKRMLLLLDDLEAEFPLREALNVLVEHNTNDTPASGRRAVLLTSRAIFPPALVTHHQHLMPLSAEAAYILLSTYIGQSLTAEEREYVEQICAALGNLPRAIEVAANALMTRRIPLALLAERVTHYPLDSLLDSDGEIHAILSQSLEVLAPTMQERFALLSILGTSSFELEQAAVLHIPSINTPEHQVLEEAVDVQDEQAGPNEEDKQDRQHRYFHQQGTGTQRRNVPLYLLQSPVIEERDTSEVAAEAMEEVVVSSTQLMRVAADLGLFVQRSLLECAPVNYVPLSVGATTVYDSLQTDTLSEIVGEKSSRYSMHPLLRATAMKRLGYLETTALEAAQNNIQQYALDILERYQSDMPRLEREREFLLTALKRAWHLEQYDVVIRLVEGMSCMMGRMETSNEGVRVLLWGIHASRLRRNRYQQAHFLNHLGTLFCYRGELAFARRALEESLEIADELGSYGHLSQPLCNLAHIAHLLDDYEAAQRYADAYLQRMKQFGDTCKLPVALFIHGFYSRLQGEQERALEDLHTAIHLFSQQSPPATYAPDSYDHIFALDIQAEFARTRGDYASSQAYVESAIAIINQSNDPYGIADRLHDQATFAFQRGAYNDARALAQRSLDMATRIHSPHIRQRSMHLLQKIAEAVQK